LNLAVVTIYRKELEKSTSFFLFIVHIIVHIFSFLTFKLNQNLTI